MNKNITIMHVLNTDRYSGAENVVITIINYMHMHYGYNFIYVSLDGKIHEICKKNNIEFAAIKKMTVKEIRRVIDIYKPDIVHAHDFRSSCICSLSMKKIPLISHLHNNPPWLHHYGINSFIYLLASFKYRNILIVSKSIQDEYVFSNFVKNKTIVINNPVDDSKIKKLSKTSKETRQYDVVFIGRLDVPKNPLKFIDIISKIKKKYPYIKSAMIGDGKLKRQCFSTIQEKNLLSNIDLLGFIDNPYGILGHSKIMCITSDWEGYGLVAIEALSLGIPVLATPVGGLTNIIQPECGRLCYSIQEFIDELDILLSNSSYYLVKSSSAEKRAEKLSNIAVYMSEINKIYRNAIG